MKGPTIKQIKFIKIIAFVILCIVCLIVGYVVGYIRGVLSNSYVTGGGLENCPPGVICKPVIYLYPKYTENVDVKLYFNGKITQSIPEYNNSVGWQVKASPNGNLINISNDKEYSFLFWEGDPKYFAYDLSSGFVVKGVDSKRFLENTLTYMGLNSKESSEFISYWLPQMQGNKYNLIHFAGSDYTDNAVLDIQPKPDSILRIFMEYRPLNSSISVKPQALSIIY